MAIEFLKFGKIDVKATLEFAQHGRHCALRPSRAPNLLQDGPGIIPVRWQRHEVLPFVGVECLGSNKVPHISCLVIDQRETVSQIVQRHHDQSANLSARTLGVHSHPRRQGLRESSSTKAMSQVELLETARWTVPRRSMRQPSLTQQCTHDAELPCQNRSAPLEGGERTRRLLDPTAWCSSRTARRGHDDPARLAGICRPRSKTRLQVSRGHRHDARHQRMP